MSRLATVTETCDLVVLGSSPLLLLVAARARHRGKRVLVLESGARAGGAWTTSSFAGFDQVEQGAHYIYGSSRTYRQFVDFGIPFTTMVPQPIAFIRGRRAPIALLQKHQRIVQSISERQYRELAFEVRRMLTYREYQYPAGGAAQLISELSRAIGADRIRLDAHVETVRIEESAQYPVQIVTRNGTIHATEAITGQGLRSCQVVFRDKAWTVLSRPTKKLHVLLLLDATAADEVSYVQFSGHDLLRCLARVERPPVDGYAIWAVQVASDASSRPADVLVEQVLAALAEIGLLRRAECVEYTISTFHGMRLLADQEWTHAIRRWLRVLPSWACLGDSIELVLASDNKDLLVH